MSEVSAPAGKILIVDDETTAVENLAHVCRKQGYEVTTETSGARAVEIIKRQRFDVVLSDLRMGKTGGMEILQQVKNTSPETSVILITGYATLDSAVNAMKAGAFHYIAKPFRLDEVREVIRNALEVVTLKRENLHLKRQIDSESRTPTIITQDPVIQRLLETARQIAPTGTNVLITGESGTGKELLARYIHNHSGLHDQSFQAVNCGSLQEELLANELFGHEKGAFTGATESRAGLIEATDGGTLFLDEIAEMSVGMQVKLLRVIQEREVQRLGSVVSRPVNIRIIAATHRNLTAEIKSGRFRQDLFYRLDVVGLHLPPLSERRDDIPLLAIHFLQKHARRMNRQVDDIETEAMLRLMQYHYPGNIRELENIIERGVAMARDKQLTVMNLPRKLDLSPDTENRQAAQPLQTLEQRETDYIRYILEQCGQNRTRAAKILGIDRVSLWRKLKKYGLEEI